MSRRFVLLVLAACGHDTPRIAPEANPLGTTANILPFPSSLYERADAASPTGVRLDVPSGAIPVPDTHAVFDTARADALTGWPSADNPLSAAPPPRAPAPHPPPLHPPASHPPARPHRRLP